MWDLNWWDLVNALVFEFGGAVVLSLDCWKLLRDKEVKGMYWPTRLFFFAWGIWNIKYYEKVQQGLSRNVGIVIVLVNFLWCVLAIYYTLRARGHSMRGIWKFTYPNGRIFVTRMPANNLD